jgi:YggT family protein
MIPCLVPLKNNHHDDRSTTSIVAAVLPGSPLVTGTLSMGTINAIELYSNVILFRIALSWFPQLVTQFPILTPIFTVTDPYLRVFRSQIPPIAGFDVSAIAALFCLNILSQTAAAVGADIPDRYTSKEARKRAMEESFSQ